MCAYTFLLHRLFHHFIFCRHVNDLLPTGVDAPEELKLLDPNKFSRSRNSTQLQLLFRSFKAQHTVYLNRYQASGQGQGGHLEFFTFCQGEHIPVLTSL